MVYVIFVVCIIMFIFCLFLASNIDNGPLFVVLIIAGALFGSASLTIALLDMNHEEKPKEFPASEYELRYKVTEYEGQRDTTYVLIRKED